MAQAAPARDAWRVKTKSAQTIPTTLVAPDPHPQRQAPDPRGRYAVQSGEGRLGVLKAVISGPRLLLLDAPQVPGGVLLIPFEAIEQIRVGERTILLRPAREALELAGERSASRGDGG
jgi:hypothetical protein